MYFSKDADSVPTFESPWIHRGWTPAPVHTPPAMGRALPPKAAKWTFRWFCLLQILPLKMSLPMISMY